MRALPSLVVAGVLACAGPTDAPHEQPEPSRTAASDPIAPVVLAPTELPAPAALRGDPQQQERAILGLANEDVPDDVLLALPGSSGIALADDAAVFVPDGAASIGSPQAGSLHAGAQLPYRPQLYTRRDPNRSFGSTHTIRTIQSAIAAMRRERRIDAEVVVGDISTPRGGPFSPHVSHQSGRDVDIRLVLAHGVDRHTIPTEPHHVDWDATWALVHGFLETGQVTYVFLDFDRQPLLYEAARRAGLHDRVLQTWFQWPHAGGPGIIRHEDGHRAHVHVRLACGPGETQCTGT